MAKKISWLAHTTTLEQLKQMKTPFLTCSKNLEKVINSSGSNNISGKFIFLQALIPEMQGLFIAGDLATVDYHERSITLILDPRILQEKDITVLHGTTKWSYGEYVNKKSIKFDNEFINKFPLMISQTNQNNQYENEIVLSCKQPVSLNKYLAMIWTDIPKTKASDKMIDKVLQGTGLLRKIPIIRQLGAIDIDKTKN